MTWNTTKRRRELWTRGTETLAVYFDINSENAICWPIESDREGEPQFTSRFDLVAGGWK